jgi:hypothetical protein
MSQSATCSCEADRGWQGVRRRCRITDAWELRSQEQNTHAGFAQMRRKLRAAGAQRGQRGNDAFIAAVLGAGLDAHGHMHVVL